MNFGVATSKCVQFFSQERITQHQALANVQTQKTLWREETISARNDLGPNTQNSNSKLKKFVNSTLWFLNAWNFEGYSVLFKFMALKIFSLKRHSDAKKLFLQERILTPTLETPTRNSRNLWTRAWKCVKFCNLEQAIQIQAANF